MSQRHRSARLVFLIALTGAAASAGAQGGDGLRLGVAAGSSDYGTAIKADLSQDLRLPLPFLRGPWRWEAQGVRFGSEDYVQFGATYQRSAWAVGASALPQLALTPSITAHGKLGVHYLTSEASGPGLSVSKSGFKLGMGAGLRWRASPAFGLKLEVENIGGTSGDLITLGLEVPL